MFEHIFFGIMIAVALVAAAAIFSLAIDEYRRNSGGGD